MKILPAITMGFDLSIPFAEMAPMIADAGFEGVSLSWEQSHSAYTRREGQNEILMLTGRYGLRIESIHAPWKTEIGILEDARRQYEVDRNVAAIIAAGAMGIEFVIVHAGWGSENDQINQKMTEAAISSMEKLSDCALRNGVKLAVENLQGARSRELTKRILEAFPQKHIGFCHDTGHEHCTLDCFKALEELGQRLFATHVHDDSGQGKDDHLLPYEGTIDWEMYITLMRKLNYSGYLLIESIRSKSDGFENSREFLKEAKIRADRLIAAITTTKQ